ncbi:hypothetical protein Barb4_02084 [Bacteroidales bacterium Barb4]|nr:hypothetical protein Barb4_02084 [Bacteroidales bacterium Barb4]
MIAFDVSCQLLSLTGFECAFRIFRQVLLIPFDRKKIMPP